MIMILCPIGITGFVSIQLEDKGRKKKETWLKECLWLQCLAVIT
jgi:hypothetical protein